ncbi:hypothetical protein E2C01_037432 [Portunus trituberculatus]|uniref:Uncharacterized protein n=1 Tax=Portunus trituberculatus TaxID=210409 RepID=A0A5B7F848_PORTR|nr:hypothetical protein [Portunus trituberculatus]
MLTVSTFFSYSIFHILHTLQLMWESGRSSVALHGRLIPHWQAKDTLLAPPTSKEEKMMK